MDISQSPHTKTKLSRENNCSGLYHPPPPKQKMFILVLPLRHKLINISTCDSSILGAVLIVMGLYSVLWGKYKEYKEKEAIEEPEAVKEGGDHNKGRMATVMEDIEANGIEMPKNETNREFVPVLAISAPIPQPPMIAVEIPKA